MNDIDLVAAFLLLLRAHFVCVLFRRQDDQLAGKLQPQATGLLIVLTQSFLLLLFLSLSLYVLSPFGCVLLFERNNYAEFVGSGQATESEDNLR